MTQQELLKEMHQYTPWELLHMQNLNQLDYMEQLNQSLAVSITETEKASGLHRPHVPDASDNTFSEQLFFPQNSLREIQIVQHDRYSPPVLHKHDFFELIYVYEGEFLHQISSQKMLMHTGDFCFVPPDIYHSLDVHNYSVVLNILVPRNTFQEFILKELKGHSLLSNLFLPYAVSRPYSDYFLFHTGGDTRLQQIVLDLCLESVNQQPYYLHMMRTDLLLLLGYLLRHYEDTCELSAPDNGKTGQAVLILQYLDKHYQHVTLSELAEKFHYSPQHMSNRIRALTGMSFTDYLLQKRMQAASDLLINTSLKVGAISESVGYRNPEHFIRTFRKYYGAPPGAYRSVHRAPLLAE
ncbi:AraC family transcriptional regulator [Lachnospiraceae bacterium 47-T17]